MSRLALIAIAVTACGAQNDGPLKPTANAGFDARARLGAVVHLDGSASDSGVTYAWNLAEQPEHGAAALAAPTTATPSFTPNVVGPYMIALFVTRDQLTSDPDVVVIDAFNGAPVAQPQCGAGSNCTVLHDRVGTLDGRASFDPDDDTIAYQWTQVTSPTQCAIACPSLSTCAPSDAVAAIASAASALATFTAPDVDGASLVFALSVSDGTASASACIVFTTRDTAPRATLAPSAATVNPATVAEGGVFTLSAAGSGDPDGDALTYDWQQTTSSFTAMLATPTAQSTSVIAPTISADPAALPYVDISFAITVSDGIDSDDKSITIRVVNTS